MDASGILSNFFGFARDLLGFCVTYFFPPTLEVVEAKTQYGKLKNYNHYALLLKVRIVNKNQQPVLVESIEVDFDGKPIERIPTNGAGISAILVRNGWLVLEETDQVFAEPFRIQPVDAVERYAFFKMPDLTKGDRSELNFTIKVGFSRRRQRELAFTVKV